MQYLKNVFREFLQIWHKRPLVLKAKLIKIQRWKVKGELF